MQKYNNLFKKNPFALHIFPSNSRTPLSYSRSMLNFLFSNNI